jgi:hypothetical protein
MKTTYWGLITILLAVLLSPTNSSAFERKALVKITHYDRTVQYQIMTPDEVKELSKEISKERWHFKNALRAAEEEWESGESARSSNFPAGIVERRVQTLRTSTDSSELEDYKRRYEAQLADDWEETVENVKRRIYAQYPLQNRNNNRGATGYMYEGRTISAEQIRKILVDEELREIREKEAALADAANLLQKHIDAKLERQASQNAALEELRAEKQRKADEIGERIKSGGGAF